MTWGKDPIPTLNYSLDDYLANPSRQDIALRGEDDLFFIDNGYIFNKSISSGEVSYVDDSDDAVSLLIYKNILVVLDDSGKVWLLSEKTGESTKWIDIGNSTTSILADDRDLVALTKNGELWIFKGSPGEVDITYVNMPLIIPISCGKVCMTTMIVLIPYPLVNGHEIAFYNSGVNGVKSISKHSGTEIIVNFSDNTSTQYNQLDLL
jgi:hypothetical protein